MTGSCDMVATIPLHCPLCHCLVPANTHHKCVKLTPKTAREKFRLHQRVRMMNWHGSLIGRTGTVTGFGTPGRRPGVVIVLIDGNKRPARWHMSRWEPIGEAARNDDGQ